MRHKSVHSPRALVQMPRPSGISRRAEAQLARLGLMWLEGLWWVGDPLIATQLNKECLLPGMRARASADQLLRGADRLLRQQRA